MARDAELLICSATSLLSIIDPQAEMPQHSRDNPAVRFLDYIGLLVAMGTNSVAAVSAVLCGGRSVLYQCTESIEDDRAQDLMSLSCRRWMIKPTWG